MTAKSLSSTSPPGASTRAYSRAASALPGMTEKAASLIIAENLPVRKGQISRVGGEKQRAFHGGRRLLDGRGVYVGAGEPLIAEREHMRRPFTGGAAYLEYGRFTGQSHQLKAPVQQPEAAPSAHKGVAQFHNAPLIRESPGVIPGRPVSYIPASALVEGETDCAFAGF